MSILTILLPDFILILIGFLLMRYTAWRTDFWAAVEKLVYYLLFPALLFYSTSRTSLDFQTDGKLLQVTVFATLAAVALAWMAKALFRTGPMIFESGMQTAFRFNSYIGLAVASRLGGEQATSLMALIIGFSVPICNTAAVHALVHRTGGLFLELAKNPLLLATAGGLLFNALGFALPELLAPVLSRLGNAAIALGLMAVGAGLQVSGLREGKPLAAYLLGVKLVALPLIGYWAGKWIGLPALQHQVAVIYCALPTAPTAYVLAVRMGGNGPFVAFLVSASTIAAAFTLPFWLGLLRM